MVKRAYVELRERVDYLKRLLTPQVVFDIYQETHDPPLESLFDGLKETE